MIKKEEISSKIVAKARIGTVTLIVVPKLLAVSTDKRNDPIITIYKIIEVTNETIDTFNAF